MAPVVAKTHRGRIHTIPRPSQAVTWPTTAPLVAFEYGSAQSSAVEPKNTLIFLGGLGDGLLTVPFVPPINAALPPSWCLVEPILGSNYRQWGISSLDDDVSEIEAFVAFFQIVRPGGRVALMGHSTGSQMIMHYLLSKHEGEGERLPIDAGIMQSSASDREAIYMLVPEKEIDRANQVAQHMVNQGRSEDVLPADVTNVVFEGSPISAKRWLSLSSPAPDHLGQDDYFSSDLSDMRLRSTFGQLGTTKTRVCWLFGSEDQFVPETVDRRALLERWHDIARKGGAVVDEGSGLVEGASHTLKEGGPVTDELVRRVIGVLHRLN